MVPADELDDLPRPRFRRYFLLPIGLVIAAAALYAGLRPAADENQDEPRRLPAFTLPLLDGGSISSDELQGKPVVLNVWASWCAPCREEAPALQRLYKRHGGHGLVVLGVNTQDDQASARSFVEEYGITYPIARDEGDDLVSELEELSGISDAWPQTFFIAPDGTLVSSDSGSAITTDRGTVLGALSEEELEARVAELFMAGLRPTP